MSNPRTLAQLRKDPRVKEVSDERGTFDQGIWVYLKAGWFNDEFDFNCTFIHEQTVAEVCNAMRHLKHRPQVLIHPSPP